MLVPKSFTGEGQHPQWNDRIGLLQAVTGKIVSKEASSNAKKSFGVLTGFSGATGGCEPCYLEDSHLKFLIPECCKDDPTF